MRCLRLCLISLPLLALAACSSSANDNAHTTATNWVTPPPTQILTVVPRPERLSALSASTSLQALQSLKILSPRSGDIVTTPNIPLRISVSKSSPHGEVNVIAPEHLHIVLDDLPYEDYYDLSKPFELRNLKPGKHTLRVFAAFAWHETYRSDLAFQMVIFSVRGNDTNSSAVNDAAPDPTKPLLTYNSPSGECKGEDADPVMLDFFITNAKLKGDGGEYRIRYFIDDDEARYVDKWEPVWLKGWTPGQHSVRLELLGADQYPVKNDGYVNIVKQEITVIR
jgi:hypothetical protein